MAEQLSLTMPQLRKRLLAISRTMPVGIVALTTPSMRKKANPFFGHVVKISHVGGWINFRYARTVNRQRVREQKKPDFKAVERSWGGRVFKTPLVEYADSEYLEIKKESRKSQIRSIQTGEIIDPKWIAPYLRKPSKSRRQKLRKEIILRDYRLDHVAEIRIDGQTWRVRKVWNRLQKILALEVPA